MDGKLKPSKFRRRNTLRNTVRYEIIRKLKIATNPDAVMRWNYPRYCRDVVIKYQVILDGWPEDMALIDFAKQNQDKLNELLTKIRQGEILWRPATPSELQNLRQGIADGTLRLPERKVRSDAGIPKIYFSDRPNHIVAPKRRKRKKSCGSEPHDLPATSELSQKIHARVTSPISHASSGEKGSDSGRFKSPDVLETCNDLTSLTTRKSHRRPPSPQGSGGLTPARQCFFDIVLNPEPPEQSQLRPPKAPVAKEQRTSERAVPHPPVPQVVCSNTTHYAQVAFPPSQSVRSEVPKLLPASFEPVPRRLAGSGFSQSEFRRHLGIGIF